MTEAQEAKLPAYARDELQRLRRLVAEYEKLDEVRPRTNVWFTGGMRRELKSYLPDRKDIHFSAAQASKLANVNDHHWSIRLGGLSSQDEPPPGSLIIRYSDDVLVQPRTSNIVHLHPGRK